MKKKGKYKTMLIVVISIIAVIFIQTLPIWFLQPLGSKSIVSDEINLNYQAGDEEGANEVFELLKQKADTIRTRMNFKSGESTNVYLYKTQWQLAIREAGFITLVFAPSWYIGDSHNGNVMMVSPFTPVKGHTHDSILVAALHEFVHSIVYKVNPKLSYFWDNGLATYLSEQKPMEKEIE
ncbi:MAG: hypothetical protein H7Y41_05905, partial [Hyphomonadaceae bacterium]|nr:hypothetical protein [Clostridia bacterium]